MPVTPGDIEDKLSRSFASGEAYRVQTDIDDAYALAESYGLLSVPETPAQAMVIRRIVLRAFRNPEGVRAVGQESLGSRSVSYVSSDERPGVYFTAQDVADMRGVRTSTYSIRLTSPADHA